ncbi:uncharacterized protein LOC121869683 [Homarus americanus]|uniref:uncharacterized protein LOC121869683 n=1 Tax=Homarus americanus TaxID=6706 RepID=UPI001C47D4EE|nr:uncharacterized protein LOC121869683 [Homarus americanus]
MRVLLVLCALLGLLVTCDALAILPVAGLPLVAPGALGALPVASLLSLQAAVILAFVKEFSGKEKKSSPKRSFAPRSPFYGSRKSSYSSYDGPVYRRQKRAILQAMEEVEQGEKLLLSAATHLDTDGCVLKLLCHLNNKQVDARTLEETVLLQMFSDNLETMSSYNTAFKNATEAEQGVCDHVLTQCPLGEEELGNVMRQTWSCASLSL